MPIDLDRWFPALVASGAVALGVVALLVAWGAWQDRREKERAIEELERLDDELSTPLRSGGRGLESVLRTEENRWPDWVWSVMEHVPRIRDAGHLLSQAGLDWRVESFLTASAGAALVAGLGFWLATRSPFLTLTAAGVAGVAPYAYARWMKSRRLGALERQLPGSIDLLSRAIRAGHPLSTGLKMVAEETPDPLATEFRVVFEEQKFGLPFEDALLGLGDRVELVDVRILITAILVQREVGGNLSEILDKIADTIRARFNVRRQIRVYTAQGRLSGYILAALPVAVGGAVYVLNPDYVRVLFEEPVGRALLATAGTLQLIGFLWIRKIVDIEY